MRPLASQRLFNSCRLLKRSCCPLPTPPVPPLMLQQLQEVAGAIPIGLEKARKSFVKPRPVKDSHAATPGPAGREPWLAATLVLAGRRLGETGSWERSLGVEGWFRAQTVKPEATPILHS